MAQGPAIDWRLFPSLTALRAFEAAARLQSFSLAARELNVTHAAVAQQVRGLEDHLGRELLFRAGRGLALSPEGIRLAAALAEGFGAIAKGLAEVQAATPGALRVTLTAAFAANWLMPRLGRFWKALRGIPSCCASACSSGKVSAIRCAQRSPRQGWTASSI